jgi:hypothetical protein
LTASGACDAPSSARSKIIVSLSAPYARVRSAMDGDILQIEFSFYFIKASPLLTETVDAMATRRTQSGATTLQKEHTRWIQFKRTVWDCEGMGASRAGGACLKRYAIPFALSIRFRCDRPTKLYPTSHASE